MSKGKTEKLGKYFQFSQYINKYNVDAAKKLLERLKIAADAGDTRICMWILDRRSSDDFGRRKYRKMDAVSENKNENVELIVIDTDGIREKIIEKIALVR
jgi:hypothetical protein